MTREEKEIIIPKKVRTRNEKQKLIENIEALKKREFSVREIAYFLWEKTQYIYSISFRKDKYTISFERANEMNKRFDEVFKMIGE